MLETEHLLPILNALPIPCLVVQVNAPVFTIEKANTAFLNLSQTSDNQVQQKPLWEAFHNYFGTAGNQLNTSLEQLLLTVIQTKAAHTTTYQQHDREEGSSGEFKNRHWTLECSPVADAAGAVTLIVICFLDKTQSASPDNEIKADKTAQPQSKEALQNIFDHLPDIICTIDGKGNFKEVSAAAEKIWGYHPNELVGRPYLDYVYQQDYEKTKAVAAAIMGGSDTTNFDNRYVRKDGTLIPMVWSARWYPAEGLIYCIARDATTKLLAEQSLQLSEQRFKSLIQDGSDLIAILDKDGNYTYVSSTSITVLGIDPSFFIGKNAFTLIHPDDLPAVLTQFTRLQTEKRLSVPPFRFQHTDGSWRWVETIVTNLLDDPAINGIVANSRDITAHIETEEILKASEERYKQLFECSPLPKLIFDLPTFALQDVNQTAIDSYGYGKKEFLEMGIIDLQTVVEASKLKQALELLKQKDGVLRLGTFTNIKKDKTPIKVEVSGHIINYLGRQSLLVVCDDVTDIQQAVEQLKDSETKLRTATKIAKLGYWRFTLNDQSLYWSDEVYEIWGKAPGSFNPSNNFIHHTIHPDDIAAYRKEEEAAVKGEKELDIEHRILLPDGSVRWVHEKGALIKDENGQPVVLEGTVQDITPQKLLSLAAEESSLRYQYVTKATFDAIWDLDLVRNELYWGEGFEILFGYKLQNNKGDISVWHKNIYPEDRPRVLETFNRIINDAAVTTWKQEYRYIKADGKIAHVVDKGIAIRDEKGKANRMLGAIQDITRQKEEELQKVLLADISKVFNEPVSLTKMLEQSLERIVHFRKFDTAEAWLVNTEKKHINLVACYAPTESTKTFFNESVHHKAFTKGVGLAGTVWKNKNLLCWRNIDEKESFIRRDAAKKAGLKTAYALPLMDKDEVIGVVILGLCKDEELPDYFSTLFGNLSTHLSAEIRRKQLELELSSIFHFAPDVICIGDTEGYLKKINPAASALLGYSEKELLSAPFIQFVHPDDVARTIKEMQVLNFGQQSIYFENRWVTKNGKIKWLAWTAAPSPDDKLVFSVAKDITEKKNLEDLLDKATNMARIGSWEVDLANEIVYWSNITRETFEVDNNFIPDLHSGINFYKSGYNRAVMIDVINNAIENGKPWDEELLIVTAKGNEKWVRAIGNAEFAHGKCVRLYGSIQDIDARKKAEIAIAVALEEKSTILESIGDGFFTVDNNWMVTYWNNQAAKMLGVAKEVVIGKNLWTMFQDNINNTFYNHCHKAVEEYSVQQFEVQYKSTGAWHAVSAYPAPNGLTVYFKDITERKSAELQLQKLNEDLQVYARELSISNKELEQFAYVASHDLQEPLRMVTSFLTQLEKKYNDLIDDKGKQYIHFAVDGAKRMRQIILDLLEFSRVGKTEDKLEEVHLDQLVEEILVLHRKQIQEKKAVINIRNLPVVYTLKSPMRQVFQNLISNSLKYHKPGLAPQITLSATETGTHWQFAIEDNGIGIDPQFFDKIFIIFQRLHNKEAYSGTGIGLSVTKKIVENLGGKIWVASEEGKGSIFYFTIAKELTT